MTDGNWWIKTTVSSLLRWNSSKRVYTASQRFMRRRMSPNCLQWWPPWHVLYQFTPLPISIPHFPTIFPGIPFQVNYLHSNSYLRFSPGETQTQTLAFPTFPAEKPCALWLSQSDILAIDLNLEPAIMGNSFWQEPWWLQHLVSSRHQW